MPAFFVNCPCSDEQRLLAKQEGTIEHVHVAPGDTVERGQVLIVLGE